MAALTILGGMSVGVMGRFDAGGIALAGPLQRLLLSLLVAQRGTGASSDMLTEALWPGERSPHPVARLHLHVHRLRARLGEESIAAGAEGYRLDLPAAEVDVWLFEDRMHALLAGHLDGANEDSLVQELEGALPLWDGVPFPDVDHPLIDAERERLTQLWLLGQETRLQHLLDRGDLDRAVELGTALAARHPTRERIQAITMSALHRVGDRAAALGVYGRTRDALREDLGLAPGPELREVCDLVLADEGEGAAPTDTGTEAIPLLREAGSAHAFGGRFDDAMDMLGQAEVRARVAGERAEQVRILREMTALAAVTGDLERARRLALEGVGAADGTDDAGTHAVLALVLTHMQRLAAAERALAASGDDGGTILWRARAQLARRRGRLDEAIVAARTAHETAVAEDPYRHEGLTMVELACALRDAGDEECFVWYRRALRRARESRRPPLAAFALASLAKAWLAWQEPGRATANAREALGLARQSGCWGFAGRAGIRLGDAADALGERMPAAWYRCQGLAFYRRVDYPLPDAERERVEGLVAAASRGV